MTIYLEAVLANGQGYIFQAVLPNCVYHLLFLLILLIVSGLSILSNLFNGFSFLVSDFIGISCKAAAYCCSLILATAGTLLAFFVIICGSYLSTGLCFAAYHNCVLLLHLIWFVLCAYNLFANDQIPCEADNQ